MKKTNPPRIVLGPNLDRFDDFGLVETGTRPTSPQAAVPPQGKPAVSLDARADTTEKAILTRLPAKTHRNLRLLAAQEGTTIQALMIEALGLLGAKYGRDLSLD